MDMIHVRFVRIDEAFPPGPKQYPVVGKESFAVTRNIQLTAEYVAVTNHCNGGRPRGD